jgi:hypothetical protein
MVCNLNGAAFTVLPIGTGGDELTAGVKGAVASL